MLATPSPAPSTSDSALDLLMPLTFFYERLQLPLPSVEFLPGDALPQPQQHLLVHESDMTPRLREQHGNAPVLEVISIERTDEYLIREVVLNCQARPIEYGAIGIHLGGFNPPVQALIVAGQEPLGAILETHIIPHTSVPTAYFTLLADQHMAKLLDTTVGTTLFGRCNTLCHADGMVIADIVEVLPPA